jgi:hypothetical protein
VEIKISQGRDGLWLRVGDSTEIVWAGGRQRVRYVRTFDDLLRNIDEFVGTDDFGKLVVRMPAPPLGEQGDGTYRVERSA